MIDVKDIQMTHRGEGCDLTIKGSKGEHLLLRLPPALRASLRDVLGPPPVPRKPGSKHRNRSLEVLDSGERAAAATGWQLWSRSATLTVAEAAAAVGMNASTLRWSFLRYHRERYIDLAEKTGRGNGRRPNALRRWAS